MFRKKDPLDWLRKRREGYLRAATDTGDIIMMLEDAAMESGTGTGYHKDRDWEGMKLALELFDSGLVRAQPINRGPFNSATTVVVTGITITGREYLDKLKREKKERTLKGRVKKALLVGGGALVTEIIHRTPDLLSWASHLFQQTRP